MTEIGANTPSLPAAYASNTENRRLTELVFKALSEHPQLNLESTAQAEVLSVQAQANNSVRISLQVLLNSGASLLLQAEGKTPLPTGTYYQIQALPGQNIQLTPIDTPDQPLNQLDLQKLPKGSFIQGQVISSQTRSGEHANMYQGVLKLLNTAFLGQKLLVESPRPLPIGQRLSLQVESPQRLSVIPPTTPKTGLISQLISQQFARQTPLSSALTVLLRHATDTPQPDESLHEALHNIQTLIPDAQELTQPQKLVQALQVSGLFLEANLAKIQPPESNSVVFDLKTALLQLVAQIKASPPPSSALITTDSTPPNSANTEGRTVPTKTSTPTGFLAQSVRQFLNQVTPNLLQQAQNFPLPERSGPSFTLPTPNPTAQPAPVEPKLMQQALAAIARIQTHQLAGLEQTHLQADGKQVTTWQAELPWSFPETQNVQCLQVRIQREQEQTDQKHSRSAAAPQTPQTQWRIDLAFDMPPLGPLQVQAHWSPDGLSSHFWAEHTQTAQLIQQELTHFRQQLIRLGIPVQELLCQQGTPPQGPQTTVQQRFVDDTA